MTGPQKVWYASYGSNILESRFRCYIAGGKPEGATRTYKGCRDKTLPEDKEQIIISSEVYFARSAKTWNGGGVAFIKNNFDEHHQTLGRMYLISQEQFEDVVRQEIGTEEPLEIDFDLVSEMGNLVVKPDSWYGNIIFLGKSRGHPIFTFTSDTDLLDQLNMPNQHYLRTISKGLREAYGYSDSELINYFQKLSGIKGTAMESEVGRMIK
ncbi:hypothetical protein [Halocola ammonii]